MKRGCLVGCLLVIVFILIVVGGGLGIVGYQINKAVVRFTDTKPADLPAVEPDPERVEALGKQFEAYKKTLDEGGVPDAIVVTEEDINVAIQGTEQWKHLRGLAHVSLEDGQVTGQVSLPLSMFDLPVYKDRYFNGLVSLDVRIENGQAEIYIKDAQVRGEPLPENVMTHLKEVNFGQDIMDNPDARQMLSHIERLEIGNGRVRLVPPGREAPLSAPAATGGGTEAQKEAGRGAEAE